MSEKVAKAGFIGISSVVTYLTENFTPLIYILILFEIIDYITCLSSLYKIGALSRETALWKFIKKILYFFLITVTFSFDYVIAMAGSIVSINFGWPAIFGVMSVCYLITTEAVSILENLAKMDVEIPFLSSALIRFSSKIEEKAKDLTGDTSPKSGSILNKNESDN